MATVSYGTITVTDLTDITDVYLEYCMAEAGLTASQVEAKTTWTSSEREWDTIYPSWQSGYEIWIRQVQIKEGVEEPEYGTPYLDNAVNQINEYFIEYIDSQGLNLEVLNTKTRFQWRNQNNYEYGHTYQIAGEWLKPDYLMGTYTASGKLDSNDKPTIDYEDSRTYGFNTYLSHNALNLRYDAINMTSLSTGALTFYIPTQSNNEWIQGKKGLEITAEGIDLYNPSGNKGLEITSNGIDIFGKNETKGLSIQSGGLVIYDPSETSSGSISLIAVQRTGFRLGYDADTLEGLDPYTAAIAEPFIVWQKAEDNEQDAHNRLYVYTDDIILRINDNSPSTQQLFLKDKLSQIDDNILANNQAINTNKQKIQKNENEISVNTQNIILNKENISKNTTDITLINNKLIKIKAYWTIDNNNHLTLVEGVLNG